MVLSSGFYRLQRTRSVAAFCIRRRSPSSLRIVSYQPRPTDLTLDLPYGVHDYSDRLPAFGSDACRTALLQKISAAKPDYSEFVRGQGTRTVLIWQKD